MLSNSCLVSTGSMPSFSFQEAGKYMKFILGKKIKMSQIFKGSKVVPVTFISAGPCFVTQIKRKDKDGYESIQIGFDKLTKKKEKKSLKEKAYKHLREFRIDKAKGKQDIPLSIGGKIIVSIFKEGDRVFVSSTSKGKGFQGGVKRWGFSGRNATHGVKHEHRTLGSVGASGPQRVFKGKKMPGRMGGERITVKNLEVVQIDEENNLIAVRGAVPGRKGSLVEIVSLIAEWPVASDKVESNKEEGRPVEPEEKKENTKENGKEENK